MSDFLIRLDAPYLPFISGVCQGPHHYEESPEERERESERKEWVE